MTTGAITVPITAITHQSRHQSRPITPTTKALVKQSRHQSRQYTYQSRFPGSFRNPRETDCEVAP
jgi:hypothetical protein